MADCQKYIGMVAGWDDKQLKSTLMAIREKITPRSASGHSAANRAYHRYVRREARKRGLL